MKEWAHGLSQVDYKLRPPPGRLDAVVRQTIIDRLVGVGSHPLAVLQGPAGSGKSTVLQQLQVALKAQKWTTAWLVFDAADNDPQRFERHLHAMLATAWPADAPTLAPLRGGAGLLEWAMEALGNIPGMMALFLDDFHTIDEPVVLQLFRSLLARLPGRVRVFLVSRSLPEIGLASLLVAGRATVLRAHDLCFSASECKAFFAKEPGLAMDEGEIARIQVQTEGWPAGLQLFKLALANPVLRASLDELAVHGPRDLTEYLTDNVVSMQRPELQNFLLRTSLMRRLTGPLCDALMKSTGSAQILRQLEHDGLFVSAIDAQGTWFRYHGLFATHLRDSLARIDPVAVTSLHGVAAQWHLAHGTFEEAVYHGIEAGDVPLAAQAMNPWAAQLISTAELVTAAHWFDRIGLDALASHVDLMIKMAWALIFLRRSAKLRPLIKMLERQRGYGSVAQTTDARVVLGMAAVFEDDLPGADALLAEWSEIQNAAVSGFAAFELGAAANLRAFHALGKGDVDAAHHLLALAHAHSERAEASFSSSYTVAVGCMVTLLTAQPRQALRRLAAALPRRERPGEAMVSAALAASHIWAAYEVGALDDVERLADQFGELIKRGAVPDFIAVALTSIARTHWARGRSDQAHATLDAMDGIAFDSGWPRLVCMVEWERVRLALLEENLLRARSIVQRISPIARPENANWLPLSELMGGQMLGSARLALHAGDWKAASQLLQAIEPWCSNRPLLCIRSQNLKALLLAQQGQHAGAQRVLLITLELAAPGECLSAFTDEGLLMHQLLERAQPALMSLSADSPIHKFALQALAAAGVSIEHALRLPSTEQAESLSEREQHVLRLLCQGASNRDLAAQLAISENTVKFHLKNLYGKLGVGSRAQAILAAHRFLGA